MAKNGKKYEEFRDEEVKAAAATMPISEPANSAADIVSLAVPYSVEATITGTADLLFHRWQCESVGEKARAAKGSKAKKTDDVQSYVWFDDRGQLCLPGEYLRQSIINAAKFKQDPRSPRKSAMDLFKAGLISETLLAPLNGGGCTKWDFEDRRRANVQRQGITRVRPAFRHGWTATVKFAVLLPEYIDPSLLNDTLVNAGRLIGVGDFRPTYGRFSVTKFELAGL